jgi:hypothetical protein
MLTHNPENERIKRAYFCARGVSSPSSIAAIFQQGLPWVRELEKALNAAKAAIRIDRATMGRSRRRGLSTSGASQRPR